MSTPFISVVPQETALSLSGDVTSLYADVFAAPPWNEAFKCTVCGKSFPSAGKNSMCCGETVCEYYPYAETKASIERCFQKTRSRIALVLSPSSDGRLAGFAWGWEESFASLSSTKLELRPEEFEELSRKCGINADDPLFYFSEFGVRQELRGKGFGKTMYRELFASIDRSDVRGILMRTSKQSPAFHVATTSVEYPLRVVYEFKDELERVILSSIPDQA